MPEVPRLFAEAALHLQAARFDEAVAAYQQVLALDPGLAAAHHNLGNALFALGKRAEAETSYRRALAAQPDFAGAHNNLGAVLLEQDRLDEAVACFRTALSLEPHYAEALNNLGAALCRQGEFTEGEASIRRALALKPGFAGAHDNLGSALWEQGKLQEAEAGVRRALQLAPGFVKAQHHLGALLKDQGRLDEAIACYRQLLRMDAENTDALDALALLLAARGDILAALDTIQQALRIRETASTKRAFVEIVKPLRWTRDDAQARRLMARALTEPWARPDELSASAALLVKQRPEIGAAVARATKAWPRPLSSAELFGQDDAAFHDELLLALLASAQNTDVELERFLTMARYSLLDTATRHAPLEPIAFYAALAQQCFINEYVFFHDEEEIRRAAELRDALAAALEAATPISPLHLLAVAAYFSLHALPNAERLLEMQWPAPITQILAQQVREPLEEAKLRPGIPKLTAIEDQVSRLVQNQYEENPYPRWVRMPPVERAGSVSSYLHRKFPLAAIRPKSGDGCAEFLSAGCGTGQLPLAIAQSVAGHVLAIDLSLSSLGYAKRKARELGLDGIEFAQADLLELSTLDRRFDVIECSGVLHHLANPFAAWQKLLSLLKPGGFMLVGLYSEAGRQAIVEARRFIAEKGYGATADDIRRCRQDLLDQGRSDVAAFGDFFGVSGCRDLLFHVQEQRLRLSAIAAFLKENGLAFLGFETDDLTLQAYRRHYPHDPAAANLRHWEAFENDRPGTFSRMYVFWIQKSGF